MNYYSQSGEDKYIHENWDKLGLPKIGTFIEVGAGDGIELSNTKMLEEMGWNGLVIEPNPHFTINLHKNRNCFKEICQITEDLNGYSFTCHNIPTWSGRQRKDGVRINVDTKRLDSLMYMYKFKFVDILSVDTEGTEIDVLKSAGEYLDKINVLIVEYDTAEIGNNKDEILEFLKDKFDLVETFQYNLLMKHK